jgi:hypothetical protein
MLPNLSGLVKLIFAQRGEITGEWFRSTGTSSAIPDSAIAEEPATTQ